jgi:hypothetical protein
MAPTATLNCYGVHVEPIELIGTGTNEGFALAAEGGPELFVPADHDQTVISTSYTEGGHLVRSTPNNPVGSGTVYIRGGRDGDTHELWYYVRWWELMLDCTRRYGGTLTYTPDEGPAITYEIETCQVSAVNSDPTTVRLGYVTSTFEFTYRPYGMLPNETVVSNANGTTPLLEFMVPEMPGATEARGYLTLTDTANQARYHVEGGLEARYFDMAAPATLLPTAPSMTALESATSTTRTGSYGSGVKRQTLTTSLNGKGLVSWTGSHVGRFRVKGRFYASAAECYARLSYSVRGGGATYRPWKLIHAILGWCEVDLGTVTIPPAMVGASSATFNIQVRAGTGSPTVDIDYLKFFPAERYFKAKGAVGTGATIRSGRFITIRHDAILTETATNVWAQHPGATGSYLRIPPEGGRIAVSANRNDIDSNFHTPLGDSLRADLIVTPRVILLGGV